MISKPGLAPVHAEGPPRRRTAEGAAVGGGRPEDRWFRWRSVLLAAGAVCSVVVVVALWVSHQGVSLLARGVLGSDDLGRLTGLVASDLLLLQVLLMARIPWVERTWGHDVLVRWHRALGFTSFLGMSAHVVLIVAEYAHHDGLSVLDQLVEFTANRRGLPLAMVGTLLLVGVVGLSVRAARRRLRYEAWHLLHLYAYLGIGLALPHQLWAGADFLASSLARIYWWTLYLAALGAVLVFRIGLPTWRSAYHRPRVAEVREEAPGVVSVRMTGHRLDRLPARAGQFFHWRFLDGPGWSRAHPYSLSAAPARNELRITVRGVGDGSRRMARLEPGTRVLIEGPFGTLTAQRRRRPRVLFIAAGVGITPIRALLEELPFAPGEATLLYRVPRSEDAVLAGEIGELVARRAVRFHYLVGPRRKAASWLPADASPRLSDAEHLERLVPGVADHDVYVCGPSAWMAAVRRSARHAGVPAARLHAEDFAW